MWRKVCIKMSQDTSGELILTEPFLSILEAFLCFSDWS